MRIVVIGAGQVGSTVVEAHHDEHDLTVIDLDEERLTVLSERFDTGILEGNGASRRTLEEAGIKPFNNGSKVVMILLIGSADWRSSRSPSCSQEATGVSSGDRSDTSRVP